ncbi:MAG TPA: RNA polymerase sigma factor [Ktedonobacterales bacterium]
MAIEPDTYEEHLVESAPLAQVMRAQRANLLRWCIYLTGDPDIAEDLVQETLTAAWRSQRRPTHAEEYPAWLAGIARNVCWSWKRRQRSESLRLVPLIDGEAPPDANPMLAESQLDLEIELEREELALLLDRALAQLPADTREALIRKYIDESPLAEIAARLGLTAGATAARLHRGKLALRRIFTTTLRAEAASFGLVSPEDEEWRQTRIWCPSCGAHRLLGQLASDDGLLMLRCPICFERSQTNLASWTDPALFRGMKSYRSSLSRLSRYAHGYYRRGLASGTARCVRCGHEAPVRRTYANELPDNVGEIAGIIVSCPACKRTALTGLNGLLLCHPQAQQFWRAHPHISTTPAQEIAVNGRAATLTRFVARTEAARLEVVSDWETLETLRIQEV